MNQSNIHKLQATAREIMRDIRDAAKKSGVEDSDDCEFFIPISIVGTDLRIVLQSGIRTETLNAVISAQGKSGIMPGMTKRDAIDKAAGILSMMSFDQAKPSDSRAEYREIAAALVRGQ